MDDGRKDFKPEELVCANCCDIPAEDCPKHGKEFIEFKCKFCCSIAQWFCWGTTHFCDSCHKRQCAGDYVSKYTKDKLPKCSGKKECPLKADHKANGDECSLGCSVCRNMKENAREF
jgi:E3 ubiquitin-protein ligase MYCBP2